MSSLVKALRKNTETIQENFLHFLWRYRRFEQTNLTTTQGQAVLVQTIGAYNTDAGPDFFNAQIQLDNTLWIGNVEIHVLSSDWNKHQHQLDAAYQNVILHVVLEEDEPIYFENGERIPCLELKNHIPQKLISQYQRIEQNTHWIPCQHQFHQVNPITKQNWLDRILVERLESKTQAIHLALAQTQNDWQTVFYRFLARNFGVKVNMQPFEQLACSLPLTTLAKHKNNLFQIEALLFGQAGLLEKEFEDKYPTQLQKEYQFLQKKYSLSPIPTETWKYMRMRPANFPTVRIAQFAQLIFQSSHLFSKILVAQSIKEIENMFELSLSNYWQTHYVFDKTSIKRKKSLGKNTIQLIIINTIIPFLFAYGQAKKEEKYKERALQFLEELPPEKNSILNQWKALGQSAHNAGDSQALLHLKKHYCSQKKCLNCAIGNAILR